MKIGTVEPEIIDLQEIILKMRKKLTEAEHIALSASIPSGLNEQCKFSNFATFRAQPHHNIRHYSGVPNKIASAKQLLLLHTGTKFGEHWITLRTVTHYEKKSSVA